MKRSVIKIVVIFVLFNMWLLKVLIFTACGLSVFSDEIVRNVMEESEIDSSLSENIVLYGIISELTNRNTNVSSVCAYDLTSILRSINEKDMWAVKVMDASGTYQGNFVWGQNAWIGSKLQCDFLNTPPKFTVSPDVPKLMDPHLISTTPPMEMEFKMIFLIIVSPYKIDPIIPLKTANTHRLGLCLPKSCSNQDIEILSERFFAQRKLKFQQLYNATMNVINVRSMNIENFLNRPEVSEIFFAIVLVTAMIITFSIANKFVEQTNLDGLKRFFKCFSIYNNVASMYDTSSSPNAINSINGIKTIICFWVVIMHCSSLSIYAFENVPVLLAASESIEAKPIMALGLYVDVFFVLSALMFVYNFLKDERTLTEVRNSKWIANIKLFAKKIIHRYVRLTPAFLFTMGISHVLTIYIQESSSLFIDDTFDSYCRSETWWYSVLYIHNLFRMEELCIFWSWSLACDMQFYIIILFILFVYARYPIFAKTLFIALFAALTAIGIYIIIDINLLPRLDSLSYHFGTYYIQPWNRMHPYLAGATLGYIMFLLKDEKFQKSRSVTISYWTVTITAILASLFLSADSSNLSVALGFTFGRYLFGLFIGSTVVMCHFGYGGIFNKILSSRLFVHINKATYLMYLLHPVLILYFTSNQEASPHFDVPSMAKTVIVILLLTYVAAVTTSPIFEIPFQKLSDEYIMQRSKIKKQN